MLLILVSRPGAVNVVVGAVGGTVDTVVDVTDVTVEAGGAMLVAGAGAVAAVVNVAVSGCAVCSVYIQFPDRCDFSSPTAMPGVSYALQY